jgi:cobalt-zinc-cadmium efflux system outer membrane protein
MAIGIDRMRASASLLLVLLLNACATMQPDAQLPRVRTLAGEQLGQNIAWGRDVMQQASMQEAVQRLLQQELTAERAVQIALLNNRELQATYADLGIAQADLVEAGLLDNPVFTITAYHGSAGSAPELSLVQDLVGLLSRAARKKVGEAAAERVTLQTAARIVDIAADVKAQYYALVGDAQALELAQQVVTATEAAAELAQRQRAAGNINRRDQALQQAFYAQTLLDLAQAQSALEADREKLNRLLGLWGTQTRWRIPEHLPGVPPALPALTAIEASAITQRLDLAAAKKQAEAASHAFDLARQMRYLGPLGIGVAYKREPGGEHFVGPVVELGLPIFNQSQARVGRAELELERSRQQVTALAVDIRSQARAALTRAQAAHQVVAHYRDVLLPLQETIVDETQKQYNGMLAGVYDLLLSKQAQVQTARQYVAATRDFWLAWSELERTVGARVPLPETIDKDSAPGSQPAPTPHGAHKP